MADIGDTVYPTLAELRQVCYVQSAGLVTVDGSAPTYDEPDRGVTFLTSNAISLAITEPSAKEQFLDPQDLTIEQRVPPINQTSVDENAELDFAALTLSRRNNVGIYGPADAHDHEDWAGSGGVASPNAAGEFAVTGSGSLTLTLACGYDQRLAEIPLQTAPAGCPLGYTYRRANVYYPGWGPNEACYCWLGWERLLLSLTAPSACTLTVTIAYREYTFSDNHLSDSTRVTEFESSYQEKRVIYSVPVVAGSQSAPVTLVAPTDETYPCFERVVSIVISGFAEGDWVIGEPLLVAADQGADPQSTQIILKAFEGPEERYQHGGASIHADAAFEWYDTTEGNLGSDNGSELTVRNFDRRTGAVSGLDLTVAYELSTWASLLQNVSEVFDASVNTSTYNAALIDDESPPNQLSVLWAFDVHFPNCEDPGNNPLEQNVSGGTANCNLRCATWSIARGIRYRIRTDKVAEGRAHGRALVDSQLLRSQVAAIKLWRQREGEDWEEVADLDADAFGHWTSPTLKEAHSYSDSEPVRWVYGIGADVSTVESIGAAYVREYVAATFGAQIAAAVLCMFEGFEGFLHAFYESGDGIRHAMRHARREWDWQDRGIVVEEGERPQAWAPGERTKRVELVYQRGDAIYYKHSLYWGQSQSLFPDSTQAWSDEELLFGTASWVGEALADVRLVAACDTPEIGGAMVLLFFDDALMPGSWMAVVHILRSRTGHGLLDLSTLALQGLTFIPAMRFRPHLGVLEYSPGNVLSAVFSADSLLPTFEDRITFADSKEMGVTLRYSGPPAELDGHLLVGACRFPEKAGALILTVEAGIVYRTVIGLGPSRLLDFESVETVEASGLSPVPEALGGLLYVHRDRLFFAWGSVPYLATSSDLGLTWTMA